MLKRFYRYAGVLIGVWLFFQTTPLWAQSDYEVAFSEKSSLHINGSSNVNEFCCFWRAASHQKSIEANLVQVDGNKLNLNHSAIRFSLLEFDCDSRRMTYDFLNLMNAEEFPYIELHIKNAQIFTTENTKFHVTAIIQMNIAGVQKTKKVRFLAADNGDNMTFNGSTRILMSEFGITPPSVLMGLVKVVDDLEVVFDLKLFVNEKG